MVVDLSAGTTELSLSEMATLAWILEDHGQMILSCVENAPATHQTFREFFSKVFDAAANQGI
jgi:hypothetical protein